jgi:histidinol phosphatase-like PHP family hydrolase
MVKLWLPEVNVGDPDNFMDRYVDWHVEIMATEPIDIMAQPTFLPDYLMPDYDRLWTERRNRKIIDAAVKHRVAIEINSRYNLPRMPFLRMALAAGARFSFGSNAHGLNTGKLPYSLQSARELKLEARHIFRPWPSGQKRVES